MVLGAVAPVVVHGDAALPHQGAALGVGQAVRGDDLLGADEIPVEGGGGAGGQGAEALPAHLQAVIHHHAGLEGAHHLHQLRPPPRLPPQLVIGEVEPQKVQPAVVGAQLPHLGVHVVQVAAEIPALVGIRRVVPHGVVTVAVVGEVWVVPVDEGEVQPRPQPGLPGGVQEFPDEIPARGAVGGLETGVRAVEQAEAVVVLGGEDGVLHPGPLGRRHPRAHITVPGVELGHEGVVSPVGNALHAAHPLPPGGDGVQPPMQKQAEPGPGEPGRPALVGVPVEYKGHKTASSSKLFYRVLPLMTSPC